MPKLISRAEALESIERERGGAPCLICAIRDGRCGAVHVLYEDDGQLVILPRFVRRWGQVMVMPKAHIESFAAVPDVVWAATNALALRSARAVERALRPRRCYLASTGSAGGEITQSSVHLHIHVIPLYDPEDRPADVFSWSAGVYVGEEDEWQALRAKLAACW